MSKSDDISTSSPFVFDIQIGERHFPKTEKITEMRAAQRQAIDELNNVLGSGSRKIVMMGPTGSGKSAIGVTVAHYMKESGMRSTYTSPLNSLVDQLESNFFDVTTLKGRKHYPCYAASRMGDDTNCAEALCRSKICATKMFNEMTEGSNELIIPTMRACKKCAESECLCEYCSYKAAKKQFEHAWIGNTNFTMFQLGLRQSHFVIIDECELIESFLRLSLRVSITERNFPEIATWDEYIALLKELVAEDKTELLAKEGKQRSMTNSGIVQRKACDELRKEIEKLSNRILRVEAIFRDYDQYHEPWVVIPEKWLDSRQKEHKSIKIEPITVDRFIENLFKEDQFVLMMSATPIIPEGWDFIELQSPFPKEIRPWVYDPVGKMTYGERDQSIPKLADYIIKLQKLRSGKLLVHCVSYQMANDIASALYARGVTHITLQTPKDEPKEEDVFESVGRNRAVEKFIESTNSDQIFLSVNMESGLDLWQSEFTTQIIAKVPFQNPNDPLYKAQEAHVQDAKRRFNTAVANKIVQAYGRINRNDMKETLTIITDESFGRFFENNRNLFRRYFLEAYTKVNKTVAGRIRR
jgi:Rad3-related DNA helicase